MPAQENLEIPTIILPSNSQNWPAGGGELGKLIRSFDWSRHPLGPPASWPQSLRMAVRMMLDSRYAMWAGWGPNLAFFYNDAYARDTLGKKHPWALGRSAREVWAEIWPDIGPRIERVLKTGEATWDEALLLFLERNGYPEETYHTFSYSPLYEDDNKIGGMLCVVTEETKRVLSERRLSLLRELGSNTTLARTVEEACDRFVQTLEQNSPDVPFALVYLLDETRDKLVLKCSVQVPETHPARCDEISLGDNSEKRWPVAAAMGSKNPVVVSNLETRFGKFAGGKWPEPVHTAVVLPIPGADADHPIGAIVLGVNPRRALDDDYEGFFQLVAGQFATALSNAQSYEKERQRAEALAEVDRAKTTFFSNVSHEFRTPLTLMLGPLEELLRQNEATSPAQTREDLDIIHRNSLRLLKLVNTLLDFSRIEAGRIRANYEPLDLAAFTIDLSSAFRSVMEKAGLRFEVKCAALREPVFVDRDMWEKILFNLLSNAFKFTLKGGVSVNLASEGGDAVLRVVDTGTGIPPEEIQNVFKRFHRVQNAQARTHEGTGIGLALVHELVKLHGGSILAESKIGEGSTFTVRIPFGKAHLPADRISSPTHQSSTALHGEFFVQEASRWSPENAAGYLEEPASLPAPQETGKQLARVLVADDNADMRDYLTRLLRGRFELETVADGDAALKAARRQKPDLVVSDIMMPGLDGFALLRALREDTSLRTVPVIFLSARAGDEARVEGIEHGADDYLVKPFSGRELVARLETHLRLARIRQEAAAKEKVLHEEAQAARERLESVLSSIDEQFLLLDREWRFIYLNHRFLQVSGKSREEMLGQNIWDLFPEIAKGTFREELFKAATSQKPVRFEYLYPTSNRWSDIRVYPVAEGVLILSTDITDRKRDEIVAERLAAIVESSDDAIISKDLNSIIASWNKGAEQIFGYTAEEVIGKPITILVPPERVNEEPEILDRIRRGERIIHYETVRRRKDGALIDISLTVSPIRDAHGTIIGASKVARDITDKVRAKEQLEHTVAERTASLREAIAQMEEFSYSVSHDLRSPVRAMHGYASALLEDYGDKLDAQGKEYLARIIQGGSRMDRLIHDVLTYSRLARQDMKLQPVNLDHLVRDILQQYPEFDPARANITIREPLPVVIGHEPSLSQAISNLLNNAVKFMPAGKRPEILIRGEVHNGQAQLWIEDNGIGIKPEYQRRLFGMFERVHRGTQYEGTGIGLAIVRKAVERMGGKAGVHSDGIHGSKFWIELSRA